MVKYFSVEGKVQKRPLHNTKLSFLNQWRSNRFWFSLQQTNILEKAILIFKFVGPFVTLASNLHYQKRDY